MYEFWYDYIKSKYQQNAKICYMDTDSFIINIKTEDVYEDIADDVEKRFHIKDLISTFCRMVNSFFRRINQIYLK